MPNNWPKIFRRKYSSSGSTCQLLKKVRVNFNISTYLLKKKIRTTELQHREVVDKDKGWIFDEKYVLSYGSS